MEDMFRFDKASASDVGLVRTNNEDSGFAGPYLLVIADGVGGSAAGEVASATTTYVTTALSMLEQAEPTTLLAHAVEQSASQLRAGVQTDPARAGMSTTFTAIATDGQRFGIAQIGDSRAYLLRAGELTQLTTDHTLVQAMVDAGQLTAAQARNSPHRNIVLRALGAQTVPEPDIAWLDLGLGDRVLLCSDGLSDLVEDHEISTLLAEPDLQTVVDSLVAAALAMGGKDNVTCIAADVVDGPRIDTVGQLIGAAWEFNHILDPAAVR